MITIVRIKAVSECMRIRRACVSYVINKNQEISLLNCSHPLKKFIKINIIDGMISWNDKEEYLQYDKEVFFHKYNQVDTGNGTEQEVLALGAVLIKLDQEMIDYYINQVQNHCVLDQWNGEYEYLIGLFYEYDLNDNEQAQTWYQKALDKKFSFEIIEE